MTKSLTTSNLTAAVDKASQQAVSSKEKSDFNNLVDRSRTEISKALPRGFDCDRIIRVAKTAVRDNIKLQQCDPLNVLAGVIKGAQLGFEVNSPLGFAYIIPYKNNNSGVMEAQFQIGYKGHLELCHRTRLYKTISAEAVYPNAVKWDYEKGLDRYLIHKPSLDGPEGEPTHYYAVYKALNGAQDFEVKTRQQIINFSEKHSSAVKGKYSSPWTTNFDEMAKKTVLKMLLKYAPKTIDLAMALDKEDSNHDLPLTVLSPTNDTTDSNDDDVVIDVKTNQ